MPPADDAAWDAWAELARRPHLVLGRRRLPRVLGGAVYVPRGQRAAILLDQDLSARDQRAALTHELVHDERSGGCATAGMPPSWRAVARRDEATVEREAARRLVPPAALAERCRALLDAGLPVEVWELAEHFDVPERLVRLAFDHLPFPHAA